MEAQSVRSLKINLDDEQRADIGVSFSLNHFEVYTDKGNVMVGSYYSTSELLQFFRDNGITDARFDYIATCMRLSHYGDPQPLV